MVNEETTEFEVVPADKKKIQKIWKTALVLAIITGIEFLFAFFWPFGGLAFIYVSLTILKAFYIVSEFMHLGHEVKALVYSIIFPLAFLCWLILAMYWEGDAIFEALKSMWGRWSN